MSDGLVRDAIELPSWETKRALEKLAAEVAQVRGLVAHSTISM